MSRKYLQTISLKKTLYLEYINSPQNSTVKQIIQLENWQMTWADILLKRIDVDDKKAYEK